MHTYFLLDASESPDNHLPACNTHTCVTLAKKINLLTTKIHECATSFSHVLHLS